MTSEEAVDDQAASTVPSAAAARIAVLGPLAVQVAGVATQLPARRQRRLLTVLAAAVGQPLPVTRDELVQALYGAGDTTRARHSLASELWRVRKTLGSAAIVSDHNAYRLNLQHVEVDLICFERLLAEGRASLRAGEFVEAEHQLAQALALWRGEPLFDWSDQPAGQAAIGRLHELHLGGIEDHAEALAGAGRPNEAIDALAALTAAEPTREHAWAELVEVCLSVGDRRRARAAFDTARRTLAEYGVDVGTELSAAQALLTQSAEPAPTTPPAIGPAPSPSGSAFVGREGELSALTDAVTGALRERRPTVVVVGGEAGIGKSALVSRMTGALVQTKVARVICDRRLELPYAALSPLLTNLSTYAPELWAVLARMLGRVADMSHDGTAREPTAVSGAGRLQDAGSGRAALLAAIADFLETAVQAIGGLVVVVEDAHWDSGAVLDAVIHILARHSTVPLCFVVTVREPAALTPTTAAALAELRDRTDCVLALSGLGQAATRQLLGPMGEQTDAVRRVHGQTGGNPLYIRQLARMYDGADGPTSRPASLDQAIAAHLAAVPVDVLAVLELAAVAGTQFDPQTLTAASEPLLALGPAQVADALAAAQATGLLRVDPEQGHGFVHGLIRDHLYARIPAEHRARAHAAHAVALRRITVGVEEPAGLLAHHCFHGWPACPASIGARQQRAAGDQAAAQLDFGEAGEFYRRGLDLISREPEFVGHELTADLLVASGQASMAEVDEPRARAAYRGLAKLAERQGMPHERLRARLAAVHSYANGRIEHRAVDQLAAAVHTSFEVVAESQADAPRWHELLGESLAALYCFRPEQARTLLEQAVETYPNAAARLRSMVWEQQDPAEQYATAQLLTADPAADQVGAALRLWVSEVATGRRALTDRPVELARPYDGSEQSHWELRLWQITVATATGEFERATRLIAAARAFPAQAALPAGAAGRSASLHGQRAWIAILSGQNYSVAAGLAANPAGWSRGHIVSPVLGAFFAAFAGDLGRARAACDQLADDLLDGEMPAGDFLGRVAVLTDACIQIGHQRSIAACRQMLRGHAGQHSLLHLVLYLGAVEYRFGRLAAAAGDLDEAVDMLEQAVTAHQRSGSTVFEAKSHRHLAAVRWHRNRGIDQRLALHSQEKAMKMAARYGLGELAAQPWPPLSPIG